MIVIINPPFIDKKSTYYHEFKYYKKYTNPALTIFAGLFYQQNIPYLCIDAKLDDLTYTDILEKIKSKSVESPPVVIGVTNSNTTLINDDLKLIHFLKDKFPSVPTIMGGPHVSALPEQTLEICKELDFICQYEGTETILELYDFLTLKNKVKSLAEIGGICYREMGMIKVNPDRTKKYLSADSLGRPRWEDFSRAHIYHVFTATGCPYRCSYCFNTTNRRFTIKPIDMVIEELNILINKNGMTHFIFADGTFAVDKKNTINLLQRMVDEGIAEKVKWECLSRVDVLDDELVSLMKTAGCSSIALGVESGSEEILKRAHKKTNIDQIYKTVKIVKKNDIFCKCFIIFGHIGETVKDIRTTINMIVKLNPDEVRIGVMTPWPGTEVYNLALERKEGLELVSNNFKTFDKYFGQSMINKNISMDKLDSLRNETFIRLYIQNRRYKDFIRFVWENKRPITQKVLSLLKKN